MFIGGFFVFSNVSPNDNICRAIFFNLSIAGITPSLLNPNLLIKPWSLGRRNSRGLGFPV